MLGIVAHDLRNPLAAIAALADGRAQEWGRIARWATRSSHAVNRMNRLIQDLIDVTRIEAGHRLSLGLERTRRRSSHLRCAESANATRVLGLS